MRVKGLQIDTVVLPSPPFQELVDLVMVVGKAVGGLPSTLIERITMNHL
jgi:hypothetical protein